MPPEAEEILIDSADINRPGIQFNGFYEFFDSNRIQIIGLNEDGFIHSLPPNNLSDIAEQFFGQKPPAVIYTRGIEVSDVFLSAALKNGVPILRTGDTTSSFMSALIAFLSVKLAPRVTRHGVLVEVYGEGILLAGESGVGKSETAIELIKRGHRLIADDAVEIRRVSAKTLVGSAPENIRHFIELRGIGIINARRIFGMGAVKLTEKIDLVVNLEVWDNEKEYDRMGLDAEVTEILGITVPALTIPIKPGRNLAIIIEVAAMNNRQKKMGYNAAQELLHRIGMEPQEHQATDENKAEWESF